MSDISSVGTNDLVVDAVFVIGTGSKNRNEELKYALRNLERNCPFIRDVYISGECPDWVDTSRVKHLKWPDRFKHAKDANIIDKLRHACEQPGISRNILFCSDDQFQTRECTWDDFAPRWLRKYSPSDTWYEDRKRIWHSRLRRTLARELTRRKESDIESGDIYYYQPHMWMQIDKYKFIDYATWCDYETRDDTIIASGYFNFASAGGKPNYDHVFISSAQKWPVNATHIAYSDSSYSAAMSYLKSTFTEPSVYEKAYNKNEEKEPVVKDSSSTRDDEDVVDDLKDRIFKEPVWHSLISDVNMAERLRSAKFNGWRKVWNDIIRRWGSATKKGALRVPVTEKMGPEASEIVKSFDLNPPADSEHSANSAQEDVTRRSTDNTEQKHCTKCEERKRKAQEDAKKARDAVADRARAIMHEKMSGLHNRTIHSSSMTSHETYACMDCAIEHLSVAVAYMNSNSARPDRIDVELAKGELRVASQHLLALKRNEEYNRCVEVLDSTSTPESKLSVSSIVDILKQVIG